MVEKKAAKKGEEVHKAVIDSGETTPLPTWVSIEEYSVRDPILAQSGYHGFLS